MKLPASIAHLPSTLLPVSDPLVESRPNARESAVLLLLYPRDSQIYLVLTRRPDSMPRHAGQISLPGGVHEEEDETLWHTALREAREEIGLRTGRVAALGRLTSYDLRHGGFVIHPFVAWSPVAPRFRVHHREVAEIIELSLECLLDASAILEETWSLRDKSWLVTFYRFDGRDVWGATASILTDLALRINAGRDLGPWPPGSVREVAV